MKDKNKIKPKYNIVSGEEILKAGGAEAWAKKNNYKFSLENYIGKVKLTPKLEKLTTKILLED
ncbi:MAG: hypothetical protein EAZ85_03450 [Bacteroidetes bacterium]|nr:MAG: hypothetical protein EAZ85_03450 [Bacteroidota bacterium]